MLAAIQPGDDALRVTTESTFFGEVQGTRQEEQRLLHNGAKTFHLEAADGHEATEWIEAELIRCLRACIRALEG